MYIIVQLVTFIAFGISKVQQTEYFGHNKPNNFILRRFQEQIFLLVFFGDKIFYGFQSKVTSVKKKTQVVIVLIYPVCKKYILHSLVI